MNKLGVHALHDAVALRLFSQTAHGHVVEHAATERADGDGDL